MDHYAVLGVPRTATPEEIKKAYRAGALKYHPDRNPGDQEAEKNFKKVQEAYDLLSDVVKRAEYDHWTFGSSHFEKPKDDNEGYASASRRYKASQKELDEVQCQFFGGNESVGRNVLVHLMVSASELAKGTVVAVKWKKRDKCKTCDGYGAAVYTNSDFVKCKACNGTGNVMSIPGKAGAVYPKCDFCDGSGVLEMFCKTCKGTGLWDMVIEETMVEIPRGTPAGNQIIIRGRGEYAKGGIAGNLHIVVLEKPA